MLPITLEKPIDSHWFKNVFAWVAESLAVSILFHNMKFYKEFVLHE